LGLTSVPTQPAGYITILLTASQLPPTGVSGLVVVEVDLYAITFLIVSPSIPGTPSIPSLPSLPFLPSLPLYPGSPLDPAGIPNVKVNSLSSNATLAVGTLAVYALSTLALNLELFIITSPIYSNGIL